MEFEYDAFTHDNAPLLSHGDQERLRGIRLLVAGCGAGSLLAEAAIRMGFEQLVLVDGDIVELSNMNRQVYEFEDIGRHKVEALCDRLKRINPQSRITVVPEFLNPANVATLVSLADIVVDFIDVLSITDIVTLHREARRQQKPVVAPLGIGWSALVLVFTPDSATIEETFQMYAGADIGDMGNANLASLLRNLKERLHGIPPYVLDGLESLVQLGSFRDAVAAAAQPVITASSMGNLAAAAVARLALGLPVVLAPQAVYFDSWLAFEGSGSQGNKLELSKI